MAKRYFTKISFSDYYGQLYHTYHPDYEFDLYDLYWNTGNGYRTDRALNARGNQTFYNGLEGWEHRDFYIGSSSPSMTGIKQSMLASSIIGMRMGCVDPGRNRTTVGNIAWFEQGDSFYEVKRSVSSNNPSFGTVGYDKKAESSERLEWIYSSALADFNPERSEKVVTTSSIVAYANNGYSCLGFWQKGVKKTSDSKIDPGDVDAIDYIAVFGKKHNVSYNSNGGSGVMSSEILFSGCSEYESYALSKNIFTRVNYVFTGWNTRADGSGKSVSDCASADDLTDSNVILYAQWRKIGYALTTSIYVPDGFSVQPLDVTVSPEPTAGLIREGSQVSITAQAEDLKGIKFDFWDVFGITVGDLYANPLQFIMPSHDVSIAAIYKLKALTVTHGVDVFSKVATDGDTSITDKEGNAVDKLYYGDEVVFHAPAHKEGYYFSGWYNGNECVSQNQNYTVVLTGDVSLVARYSTIVWVIKSERDGGFGHLLVDGSLYEGVERISLFKELGSTMRIGAVLTSGAFGGWYHDDALLELFQEDAVVVTSKYDYYTANLIAYPITVQVTCRSVKNSDTDDGALGTLALAGAGVTDNGNGSYSVEGFTEVVLTATQADGGLPLFRVMEEVAGVESAIDISKPIRILSSDRTFIARWGSKGKFQVQVLSADNAAGMAYIGESAAVTILTGEQDSTVTITALPSNGYRFVGWYEGDRLVSEKARYSFALVEPVSLQARFAEDAAAICVWEGSGENKRLSWKSKVFVMPRPFDPVAARVDAVGYPVSLSVGTYSSPDAVPTRDHDVQVQNQSGRRLPRMRAERFLRISVESAHEVDSVVVATNLVEVN